VISTIFAAVKETLENALRDEGVELPRQELGAWKLPQTSAPNQIVWAVVGGPVSAPRQTGQGSAALGTRQIATRNETVLVHVWGKGGFDETERLLNHFVAACRRACTSYSFEAKHTDWTVGQESVTVTGRLCVLTMVIAIPFTAEPLAISSAPHAATVTGSFNPVRSRRRAGHFRRT
jgi:hypothetical protein